MGDFAGHLYRLGKAFQVVDADHVDRKSAPVRRVFVAEELLSAGRAALAEEYVDDAVSVLARVVVSPALVDELPQPGHHPGDLAARVRAFGGEDVELEREWVG